LGAKPRTPSFASIIPRPDTDRDHVGGRSDRASSTIADSVAASSSAGVGLLVRSATVPSG
jgi:hypothetical protein